MTDEHSLQEKREVEHLRRLVRDLVALSSLAGIYTARPLDEIAANVTASVLRVLHADFVALSVRTSEGRFRFLQTQEGTANPAVADALCHAVQSGAAVPPDVVHLRVPEALGGTDATAYSVPVGQVGYLSAGASRDGFPDDDEALLLRVAANQAATAIRGFEVEAQLLQRTATLESIARTGRAVAAELDLEKLVQAVTDAGTELTGAKFGAFFYNAIDDQGESYVLYTLSGVPREAFERFTLPRNTAIFGPTFRGEGVVRLDDVLADARYGKNPPFRGMPEGHLPVRSYLAVPVLDRSGEVLGGLFFGHPDPGVFREQSEELVTALAAQTSIAIDNARLYERERAATRARDEFLSVAAHELKTPLTSLWGDAQLARRHLARKSGESQELALRDLEQLDGQLARLARLVDRLLDVGRLETGKLQLFMESVDLGELAHEVVARMGSLAADHALDLQADPGVVVTGDPLRLEQVLWNLVSNALKYSPAGSSVAIRVVDGDLATVHVSDRGPGVPAEDRERIFDRFYQVADARHAPGMGLGLFVAREIVQRHGGTIRVEDAGSHGAHFVVTLPKAPLEQA